MAAQSAKKKTTTKKSAAKGGTFEVELEFLRSTKGTHVYTDDPTGDGYFRSLYLPKTKLGEDAPETLTVTLSW